MERQKLATRGRWLAASMTLLGSGTLTQLQLVRLTLA